MPFNLGIGEIALIVASLGATAAVVYGVVRLLGRGVNLLGSGGVGREELEAEKRALERRIEALERRDRLPKG